MTINLNTYWLKGASQNFFCTLIIVLLSIKGLFAQANEPGIFFEHYGPQQGFNSSQSLCMGKTSDGFLWIGTDLGLVRFDGHQFETYLHEEDNNQSITGDYVRNLKVDKHDRIWMDAGEKLCVFDWKNKTMIVPVIPSKSDKRERYNIFYEEKPDRMWVATNDGIFFNEGPAIDLKELKLKNVKSKSFLDVVANPANGIWMLSGEGLLAYQRNTDSVRVFKSDFQTNEIPSDYLSMYMDEDYIWIGCWVNGLVRFDLKTRKQKTFVWQDVSKYQNGILNIQRSGIKGDEDHLWLATTSGIITFNKKTEKFTNYFSENNYDHFKINGNGFSFLPNKKDGFWIGTSKGLHRYDPKKQLIQHKKLSVNQTYQNYEIHDFCPEKGKRDSIVYLRYYYADVIKYDLINNKVIALPSKIQKYCDGKREIYSIFLDNKQKLWLTSRSDGIVILDVKTNQLIIPKNGNDFVKENVIFNVLQNGKGQIYLTGYNKFFQYDELNNEIKELDELSALMKKENIKQYIKAVSFDANDNIWFALENYRLNEDLIVKYDRNLHTLTKLNSQIASVNKIIRDVESLKFNDNNTLFISSQSGLVEYDEQSRRFKDLKLVRSRCIEMGKGKDIWVSTDFGISKIDNKSGIVTNFTLFNSPIGQSSHPLIVKSPNEKVLWIMQKGVLNFISLNDLTEGERDTIQLTGLKIKDVDQLRIDAKNILNLKYNQNEINLRFSIFNFTNSTENIYQYNLNNEGWKSMKGNELTFHELAHGAYSLDVRAFNSFGLPSANNYTMKFEIKAPFWKRGWFNFVVLFLLASAIYSVFRYRERQRLKLEKLRFNIARDLHDDLGSNLSQIKLISEIESMKNEDSKFTVVAHKLDDVMQNMKEIVWSINPKYDQLEEVVAKIQEFAIQTLESKGVNLKFDIGEIPKSIKLSPENKRNYYLIFKEAINNIIKYAQADNVYFSIKSNGRAMVTTLRDDGKGFDQNLIHYGNGLKNMKTRSLAMKARLSINTTKDGTTIELVI